MTTVYENPWREETYHVTNLSMAAARALLNRGVVFYDFTKLTAINTCPTWGVLRYGLHKTEVPLTTSGRNMPVEAGSACHEYFAALRLYTMLRDLDPLTDIAVRVHQHGTRLFGLERWQEMCETLRVANDPVTKAINFSLVALHTSGFYDDPSERRRTMANMEAACINYTTRYLSAQNPVYYDDNLIGVEVPFVLEVQRQKVIRSNPPHEDKVMRIDGDVQYYCGRIDGIERVGDTICVGENKTASALNNAWRTSFAISHQVTGYTIAGSELVGREVQDATVMGAQIPPPRDVYNGVVFEPLCRSHEDRVRWFEWFFDSIATYEKYLHTPTQAPRYSHACNRYFSSCQFIPFCASARSEQEDIIASMRHDEWSPLDHLDEETGGVE